MLVERKGVFAAAVEGIKAAKRAGFQVCTNTTLYKNTTSDEVAVLFGFLSELGVDGMMISPAYGYDAVVKQSAGRHRAVHDPRRGPRLVPSAPRTCCGSST